LTESEFARAVREAGGRAFIAGGWVRDRLRGAAPRDRDYVVAGLAENAFAAAFGGARRVGRGFPVYLLEIGGYLCEVAFARRERKTGPGYRGFEISAHPDIAIEDDLYRRDTTMNSMAVSLETGTLIDPYGGARDIERRVIRATSEHFSDDPVRALRAARHSARFGYAIEPETVRMMRKCRDELALEPGERLAEELRGALGCDAPSVFFRNLKEAGVLDAAYPQIASLAGAVHDARRHPEDAFERAMQVLDRAAKMTARTEARFAALMIGMDAAALREWNARTPLPSRWTRCAEFAITERARVQNIREPDEIVAFMERIRNHPLALDGITAVTRADTGVTPPFLERAPKLLEAMNETSGRDIPDDLRGPARGEWLRRRRAESISLNHRQNLGAAPQTPQGDTSPREEQRGTP
jgi:tRNA nucleotidyltransferase (CCA-adding enzyme)